MSAPAAARAAHEASLWGVRAQAWAEAEEAQVPTYAAALERVELRQGMAVLDIGCGAGVFLELAARHGAQPFGIDASAEMVELTRRRVPGADVRVGDMLRLPHADGTFDAVFGFNAFFFADDMVGALREAGRVARAGAPVVIQVWGRPERCGLTAMKSAVFPLGVTAPSTPSAPPPLYRAGVLEAMARDAGLTPQTSFDVRYAFEYVDAEALVRQLLAPAPVARAVAAVGEAPVREAILRSMSPFRARDGRYRVENEWHYLIASS